MSSFSPSMSRTLIAALATAGERPLSGFAEQIVSGVAQTVCGAVGVECGSALDEVASGTVSETADISREILENPTLGKIGIEFRYQLGNFMGKWNCLFSDELTLAC